MVLLCARLVAARRRGEFTMMRARGLAPAGCRRALGGWAAVALPAAVLGAGAAIAVTPGRLGLAWSLAG